MTHEFTINGRLAVNLTPDGDIEALILKKMADASVKGQKVIIESAGDGTGTIVVSVGQ